MQYSYGTLGRDLQLDNIYIKNYIQAAKVTNSYTKGTERMLRAMTHDQLRAFANDEERIKHRYPSAGEEIPDTGEEILDFMSTLGLDWDSDNGIWI